MKGIGVYISNDNNILSSNNILTIQNEFVSGEIITQKKNRSILTSRIRFKIETEWDKHKKTHKTVRA